MISKYCPHWRRNVNTWRYTMLYQYWGKWMCLLLSRVRFFVTPWTVSQRDCSVCEILQARILEWVAMPSSTGSSRPKVSRIAGRFFTIWAIREVPSIEEGGAKDFGLFSKTKISLDKKTYAQVKQLWMNGFKCIYSLSGSQKLRDSLHSVQ